MTDILDKISFRGGKKNEAEESYFLEKRVVSRKYSELISSTPGHMWLGTEAHPELSPTAEDTSSDRSASLTGLSVRGEIELNVSLY